ncbi:MAG: SPOR domain-containing protein [Candidatus Eisenbacteria bacterium]|nr:SPOR domain-containing protein [Candidatus Eisenbacteria bacterium]
MRIDPPRAIPWLFLGGILLAGILLAASPAPAQGQGRGNILRGILDGLGDSPEEIEREARARRDPAQALPLYATLASRFDDHPEGVRAALWIGLYYYQTAEYEKALPQFEKARKNAGDGATRARATFWCEQTRRMAGREPLAESSQDDVGFWGVLRRLVGVDRAIREGRRGVAESELLPLEGQAREEGALALTLARWAEIFRLPGQGRMTRAALMPQERAIAGLPEGLRFEQEGGLAAPPPEESWSIQFGAFLDAQNAREQLDSLQAKGIDARIDESDEADRRWFRIRAGEFHSQAEAESLAQGIVGPDSIPHQIVRVR